MSSLKRHAVLVLSAVAALALSALLAGCGQQQAATWAHGQILEEDVTSQINSMKSSATSSSSTSSDESSDNSEDSSDDGDKWVTYIKERSYDSDVSDEDKEKADGTIADLRKYVIDQLMRTSVINYEVAQKNYEISDEELDSYVEEQQSLYESYYGQGMSGTFESILQLMGYKNLEAFKTQAKGTLQTRKLQEEITGKDEGDDDFDEDAWDKYVDGLVENADVHINDMPSDMSYDPDSPNYSASTSSSTSDSSSESSDDSSSDSSSTDTSGDASGSESTDTSADTTSSDTTSTDAGSDTTNAN